MTDKTDRVLNAARTINDLRDAEAHMFEKDKDWSRIGVLICVCSAAATCGFVWLTVWAFSG